MIVYSSKFTNNYHYSTKYMTCNKKTVNSQTILITMKYKKFGLIMAEHNTTMYSILNLQLFQT